ncbi:MAG: DUF4956 domain-containing protein [Candidatus Limnocylindria bacterium]
MVLETALFDQAALLSLVARFALDLVVVVIIVHLIYFRAKPDGNFAFTFYVLNVLVFFVSYLMVGIDIGVGFAFGLFALFTIIRYRSVTLPVKEMSYLFAIVTVAIVNGLSQLGFSWSEVLFVDAAIIGTIWLLDRMWLPAQMGQEYLVYEKIQNVRPDANETLIADLRARTGLDIKSAQVGRLNFLNDTALVKIRYTRTAGERIAAEGDGDDDD